MSCLRLNLPKCRWLHKPQQRICCRNRAGSCLENSDSFSVLLPVLLQYFYFFHIRSSVCWNTLFGAQSTSWWLRLSTYRNARSGQSIAQTKLSGCVSLSSQLFYFILWVFVCDFILFFPQFNPNSANMFFALILTV